jgi:hypothetical protein
MIPSSQRLYAWSFVGEAGKSSRPEVVRALSAIEPHLCFSTSSVRGFTFFNKNSTGKKKIPQEGAFEILRQSVFAPSPMGNANIECERFYDALEVGAIPIVERRLTLDYYRQFLGDHPVPTVRSWSQARNLVNHLLKDPAKLDELQHTCVQWWTGYKLELTKRIGSFLDDRSRSSEELVPLQSRLPRLPFWQYGELLRHQSVSGLGRRVVRQARRIVTQKKWRVAITKPSDL